MRYVGPPLSSSCANSRSMPCRTSLDVIGEPSSNRMPSRSVNVYVSPSAEIVGAAAARSGTSFSPSAPGLASGVSSVRT